MLVTVCLCQDLKNKGWNCLQHDVLVRQGDIVLLLELKTQLVLSCLGYLVSHFLPSKTLVCHLDGLGVNLSGLEHLGDLLFFYFEKLYFVLHRE